VPEFTIASKITPNCLTTGSTLTNKERSASVDIPPWKHVASMHRSCSAQPLGNIISTMHITKSIAANRRGSCQYI